MTIESNNKKLNIPEIKGLSISPTAGGITAPKMPDHVLLEKPKMIFEGMTQNDADYYGLRVEYDAANTDGQDGITKQEFDEYLAKTATKAKDSTDKTDAKPETVEQETAVPAEEANTEEVTEDGTVRIQQFNLQRIEQIGINAEAESAMEKLKNYKIDLSNKIQSLEIMKNKTRLREYLKSLFKAGLTKAEIEEQIEYSNGITDEKQKEEYLEILNHFNKMFAEADCTKNAKGEIIEQGDGILSAEEIKNFYNSKSKSLAEYINKELGIESKDSISTTSTSGKRTLTNAEYVNTDSFGNKITELVKKTGDDNGNIISHDKRRLKSGTYIVQEGDTLEDIATDFNISLIQLYMNNQKVLGKNQNLTPGTALTISGFQTEAKGESRIEVEKKIVDIISGDDDTKSKIQNFAKLMQNYTPESKIFVGMTEQQAKDAGVHELWEKYSCGRGEIISHAFAKYQKSISPVDSSDIMALVKVAIGDDLDLSDIGLFTETLLPMMMDCSGQKGTSTAYLDSKAEIERTIKNLDGLTPDEIGEKSKQLMATLVNKADQEIRSHGKTFQSHLERLKKGEFSHFEKMQGLQDGIKLTDEQIEHYAIAATKAEYILPVINAVGEAINKKDDAQIMALVANLGTQFFDLPDVILVVQAYGLGNICEKLKSKLASMIADNAITDGASEGSQAFLGAVIASTGNAEALEVYSQKVIDTVDNFDDYIDVLQTTINKMPEETQIKLNEVLNNVKASAPANSSESGNKITTSGGGSAGGSNSTSAGQNQVGIQGGNYNNASAYEVESTRTQSRDFMDSRGIKDIGREQETVNQTALKIKNEMSIPEKLRYAQARIQNMSKNKMFEIVAKNFDQIPDQYKEQVTNYFKQMPTQILVETAIGNDEVKDFMFEHKFIKMEDILNYVRKHPQLAESGNKQISDSLKKQLQEYLKDNKINDVQLTETT